MKKATLILASTSALAAFLLIAGTPQAHATTADSQTTNGTVQFEAGDTSTPVDPGNPNTPTDPGTPTPTDPLDPSNPNPGQPTDPNNPETPITPTVGPLTLVAVPSFNFGIHKVTSNDQVLNAYGTHITVNGTQESRNPYVQVSDLRGVAGDWSVSVKQNGQFTSGSNVLTGAVIKFGSNGTPTASSWYDSTNTLGTPTIDNAADGQQLDATGAAATDVYAYNASTNGNVGGPKNTLYSFGAADGSDLVATTGNHPDDASLQPTSVYHTTADGYSTGVTLSVPAASVQVGSYSTTLTWTLSDTPTYN